MGDVDCVVIGGGVIGLSVTYNLRKAGMKRVALVEQSFLGSGASTKNASNVASTHDLSHPENVHVEKEAFDTYARLTSELGFNVLHEPQAHYVLAYTEDDVTFLANLVRVHQKVGLKTRLISVKQLKKRMPYLNVARVLAVAIQASEAKVHHDAVIWAYARKLAEVGAEIHTHTKVTGFEIKNRQITAVQTSDGRIAAPLVVNAAGAWSKEISSLAGVVLPVEIRKRQMLVTESLLHFTNDLVTSLETNLYFNQTLRGEVLIGGVQDGPVVTNYDQSTDLSFLRKATKAIVRLFPALAQVRLMRSWAGLRDRAPDGNPFVGFSDGVSGLYQVNAFFGYGLTWAPVMGQSVAADILGLTPQVALERYRPNRFQNVS